jgi:phenylalanyl-tRNA synthetase alpha chain
MEALKQYETQLLEALQKVENETQLNDLKAQYLGKKGYIAQAMQGMKDLSPEERPAFGQAINAVKESWQTHFDSRQKALVEDVLNARLQQEWIDVSLPGRSLPRGSKHLLTQIIERIEDLFIGMGYEIKEGPEVESDLFNFEKLNLPADHPARDMQDSFYIDEHTLLRTHTSPVQVRTMLAYGGKRPVRIICPGKVYRRDDDDATHSHQFMQIEGLVVDHTTSMSDLKGTLLAVAKAMFGSERKIRLRPSYFPFTEPSVEVDVSCSHCDGQGCSVCKHTGWIEILGAGMVHDNVLKEAGYDPSVYQGFAFGLGVERIAMLAYGIEDIRHFYTNDRRFLRQFNDDQGGLSE